MRYSSEISPVSDFQQGDNLFSRNRPIYHLGSLDLVEHCPCDLRDFPVRDVGFLERMWNVELRNEFRGTIGAFQRRCLWASRIEADAKTLGDWTKPFRCDARHEANYVRQGYA